MTVPPHRTAVRTKLNNVCETPWEMEGVNVNASVCSGLVLFSESILGRQGYTGTALLLGRRG